MKPLVFCMVDDAKLDNIDKYPSCTINGKIRDLDVSNGELIDKEIADKSFFNNKKIMDIINHVKTNKSNLHITGLLSDNDDYSKISHLLSLIDLISSNGINNVYFYLFIDGDVDDNAINNLKKVIKKMKEKNIGTLGLVAGKSYMLGSDNLENLKKIYDAICYKLGKKYDNLKDYFKDNYKNKLVIDIFGPGIINETEISDGDAIISFNYNDDNKTEVIDIISNPNNYNIKGLRHFNNLKTLSFDELVIKKEKIPNNIKELRVYSSEKNISYIFGLENSENIEKIKVKDESKKIETISSHINKYDLIITDTKNIADLLELTQKIKATLIIYFMNNNKIVVCDKNVKLCDGDISSIPSTILSLLGKKVGESLVKKNGYSKKSKIFMIVSVVLMVSLFLTYLIRFIHFYKIEHPKMVVDNSLISKVMSQKIVDDNGLVVSKDDYIFKGRVANNYVLYSGYLFRIVQVNKDLTMKLVTDDPTTSLVWSYDTDYKNSYARKYLEQVFFKKLNNPDKYLKSTDWCLGKVKNTKYSCQGVVKSKVGLLTLNEYAKAGLNNSYLNNGKYWWTLNTSNANKVWYIFSEGGMNDESINQSYGIRPSILLKSNTVCVSGKGTKEDPYIIEDDKELNVGKYINYSGYKWKIIESKDNLKLVLAECLKENDECISHNFGSTNIYSEKYGSLGHYLNNTFYDSLDDSHIVTSNWYIGDYNEETSYDYNNIFTENVEANVGILNIVENDIENSYTLNRSDDELIYTLNNGTLYSSDPKEKLNVYPSIYIDKNFEIKSGKGTINDPYEIGDKVEK